MVTKNFKRVAGTLLTIGYIRANVPVTGTNGTTYYLSGSTESGYFPGGTYTTLATGNGLGPGIAVGTGTTTPTEDDYRIETPITSGLSFTNQYNASSKDVDANGNPTLVYSMLLKNTGSQAITITEVAYSQTMKVCASMDSSNTTPVSICMDRTLLDSPVTIQPGELGCIRYALKATVIS